MMVLVQQSEKPTEPNIPSTDLGFVPIPKRLRYDPNKPFHFGLTLNIAFGFASTFGSLQLCTLPRRLHDF